jgi:hypothetical protein
VNHAIEQGVEHDHALAERSSPEGRAVRTKRVNHAIEQKDRALPACTARLRMLWWSGPDAWF